MKLLIAAIAVGLLATGASAQTTVTKTVVTPTHETTMTRTQTAQHTVVSGDDKRHHRHNRKCYNQWRNGKKVHICRTRHNHM